ncbi:hypothetical protein EWB00_006689 [Schistosoma japonicum]|uniref:Uncharacterized protein n=1 Tax=Schistosoma japonicum TaxID=6182 RepID=A0A4Z2CXN2_SCHJA|nr:hypothetical protein EWB00_006689 [Schistosoma japonicum]
MLSSNMNCLHSKTNDPIADGQIHSRHILAKEVNSLNNNIKKVNDNSKSTFKSSLKLPHQLKKCDKDVNHLKQKLNTFQSNKRSVSKPTLCRLQDLCIEDRRKLNKLIIKLAEAQEALNIMDSKFEQQSINNKFSTHDATIGLNHLIDSDIYSSSITEHKLFPTKAEQLIAFYKTKLETLENELSQLRGDFKEKPPILKHENNQSTKQSIEVNPTIINDVQQLNHSHTNANNFKEQSSNQSVVLSPQILSSQRDGDDPCDRHMPHSNYENLHKNSGVTDNESKHIKSADDYKDDNINEETIYQTKGSQKRTVSSNPEQQCSRVLPVWKFINSSYDKSLVKIQSRNTISVIPNHQTVRNDVSVMTEPVDIIIQTISPTCTEQATQTLVNESTNLFNSNDKCKNYLEECNLFSFTTTPQLSQQPTNNLSVILDTENIKSLTNSSVQTDIGNHHRNKIRGRRARWCEKKTQNSQTRKKRSIIRDKLVQMKPSSSSASSSCCSTSSLSVFSMYEDDINEVKSPSSRRHQKQSHHKARNLIQTPNCSDSTSMCGIQPIDKKIEILHSINDKTEIENVKLINTPFLHCKISQGHNHQSTTTTATTTSSKQQNKIIPDTELESIIHIMNTTFHSHHSFNPVEHKQFSLNDTYKNYNNTSNHSNHNQNNQSSLSSLLLLPYEQEDRIMMTNNELCLGQVNHVNNYYDHDCCCYSKNCQDEWLVSNEVHKDYIGNNTLEEDIEEELLHDLFFIK